jgi:hypothetical protein
MDGLEALNDILDDFESRTAATGARAKAVLYTPWLAAYSMYLRISEILISSLLVALAVAFGIMLLSVNFSVALIIAVIVIMVDLDLYAAIYYFDNNLAPFSYAAVVISVGLCLDCKCWHPLVSSTAQFRSDLPYPLTGLPVSCHACHTALVLLQTRSTWRRSICYVTIRIRTRGCRRQSRAWAKLCSMAG